jgi:hypothetical protein
MQPSETFYPALLSSTVSYWLPLYTTFDHIIGSFLRLSRDFAHEFQKSCEFLRHANAFNSASTACAFNQEGQRHLVVLFCAVRKMVSRPPVPPEDLFDRPFRLLMRWNSLSPQSFPFSLAWEGDPCYTTLTVGSLIQGAFIMEWTTPQHEVIDLNCEISSYANAEL